MPDAMTRRGFLSVATAGAGCALLGRSVPAVGTQPGATLPPWPEAKVYRVYVNRPRGAWPKPEFDAPAEVAKFEQRLAEMRPRLEGIRLVGGELVQTPEEAARTAAAVRNADGVLIVHLGIATAPLMKSIIDAGRPCVVFSQPFSGHDWMDVRTWARSGARVALMATRDLGQLEAAVRLVSVPGRMARSRIVLVGAADGTAPARSPENVRSRLGTTVVPIAVEQLVAAHRAVDAGMAEAEADRWIRQARRVIEPPREEIVKSARMYLALVHILRTERAQACTIRCLGGIPIDVLGYPCLAFTRMLDAGLVGACEADMDSTLTMLMFAYAFGVPGFITDPLFDTARNAVIHAHCTAPTRMDGPSGPPAPYDIRTHRDDNRGAALQVEMRLGQVITCAKLVNLDTMLVSTGKIIEVPDFDDRGCRTQITTGVDDAQQMLDNWGASLLEKEGWMAQLHRVVFYGDHTAGVRHLSGLLGFKVVRAI